MNPVKTTQYPEGFMSVVYEDGKNTVYQAVFHTKKYGTYSRVGKKWLPLAPDDTSLENLDFIDIAPANYKTVTTMFDEAQSNNTHLKYEDVEKYGIATPYEDGGTE